MERKCKSSCRLYLKLKEGHFEHFKIFWGKVSWCLEVLAGKNAIEIKKLQNFNPVLKYELKSVPF